MGTIDEIKRLQTEGKSEQEISAILKQRGLSDKEISDSIAQTKIKEAVSTGGTGLNENVLPEVPSPVEDSENIVGGKAAGYESGETYGMSPSIVAQEEQNLPQQEQYGYEYQQNQYPEYQPYQENVNTELITEISEQVASEKIAALKDRTDKVVGFMSVAEARISSLDERLKRIEKIIDRLELSIMQRVGEYITDVKDIKNELEETQKSFKALIGQRHPHNVQHKHGKGHHP